MKRKRSQLTLGVDLGGSKVKTALVDADGKVLSTSKCPTRAEEGAETVVQDILNCIKACLGKQDDEAVAIGVGVAAQVDRKGVVHSAPNLGWQNVALKTMLEKVLEMPVLVVNDVNAAAWGEWKYGAGQGVDDLVVLFVGTGIGGGVVSGGKLMEGCSNTAAELGHMTIVAEGRKCRCPNRGCLEAYAGGWALAERAQKAAASHPEAGLRLLSYAGSIEEITAESVCYAYGEGDPLAKQLVEETAVYLAAGVVSIVNAFNPCMLILGGGVVEGIPDLVQMTINHVKKRAIPPAAKNLRCVKAALGCDAGVIGAATLTHKQLLQPQL